MRLRFVVTASVFALASFTVSSLAPQAWADTFTVSIFQSGNDVVATGNGSLSVSGTTDSGSPYKGVSSYPAILILGSGEATVYSGVSGPSDFGIGGPVIPPTSSTGGVVGFTTEVVNDFFVPFGYVAGSPLTSSDTWDNATFRDLALNVGSYSYTLGSGDTFVINITSTPEPSTFALLGTGLLGIGGMVRKRFA